MGMLVDGVYIQSIIHTGYWDCMIALALISGILTIVCGIIALVFAAERDDGWHSFAIYALISFAICAAFVGEAGEHKGDVGGYTVYITQDADMQALFDQYKITSVSGDIWTVEPKVQLTPEEAQ